MTAREFHPPKLLELASHIYFQIQRLDPDEDIPWDELDDGAVEFYACLANEILNAKGLIEQALTERGH